ncbi:MAG TPA: hypothetical protein VM345_02010 [Acidimicrobiales bacterium]|nr:hypothetical protein [Acidimicrobiales bacterium]
MAASTDAATRDALVERIAARLDLPFTIAGGLIVVVVVADNLTSAGAPQKPFWNLAAWILWFLFVIEFVLRLVLAPSKVTFFRRNWWQLLFLAVPFLRFLRAFTRAARFARVASTSVRTTRTAGRTLLGRLGVLAGVAVATILAATEVLFEYGPDLAYGRALHGVALGAISGQPLPVDGAVAAVLDVVLAVHSAVVFASLAGSLGAFFLERRSDQSEAERALLADVA